MTLPTRTPGIFTAAGRVGRLRYIGYGLVLQVALGLLLMVIGFFSLFFISAGGQTATVVFAILDGLLVLLALGFLVLWTVQRCHDFNASGWWSVLVLVPLAGLVFWFIPGSEGDNHYGPPPPENGVGVILAVTLPLVGALPVLGILAAIAVPAYNSYQETARQAAVEEARLEAAARGETPRKSAPAAPQWQRQNHPR